MKVKFYLPLDEPHEHMFLYNLYLTVVSNLWPLIVPYSSQPYHSRLACYGRPSWLQQLSYLLVALLTFKRHSFGIGRAPLA